MKIVVLCEAQTVSSFFKLKKSLKIVVEGCTVKLVEEKVYLNDFICLLLKFLQNNIVDKEIPCCSISDMKYSNNDFNTHCFSFSVGKKNYNYQASTKESVFSIKQAICKGQFIEKWNKR